eukprot:TRINITY_DN2276_c0_g1_i1.p1 TRINITY_DN2276_c0_g1~~TRINITY_DN2276_c0_g1_i1.p1  ORF type:complete len:475 (+),score=62.44 TRINITY_DN2276_c0_g1_i1:183-1427(+)
MNVSTPSVVNVLAYGAKGDGVADDTPAFQAALNDMNKQGGGIVFAPRGLFRFNSNITIPRAVTLQGTYNAPPSHQGFEDGSKLLPDVGTVFLVYGGAKQINGPPFITIRADATLRGVTIFYPDQVRAGIPIPYPYAISMYEDNPALYDTELVNPYQAIYAVGAARHYIARVQGQPLFMGIFVDSTYDIGRIENVHWNPWFSMETTLFNWQLANGRAFVIARSDWEYVLNTFAFGYNIGYHFVESATGVCNGNFVGIGADNCYTSIQIDAAAPYGLLITNAEFTSFNGPDPTEIVVGANNTGKIQFVNSAFWGPGHQIAKIYGKGVVGFDSCTFCQWNADKTGRAAIQVYGGSVIIQGSEFQQAYPQVYLDASINRAVVMGNLITGPLNITNNKKTGGQDRVQIMGNAIGDGNGF